MRALEEGLTSIGEWCEQYPKSISLLVFIVLVSAIIGAIWWIPMIVGPTKVICLS